MGLEYKCSSLHYHSPETLSALCLPFYQHNPPPCLLLLFQTGNRVGDFYYVMHSGCSAPTTDECLFPLIRSDSLHPILLAVGLATLETECCSNSVLECLHLWAVLWTSRFKLYRQVFIVFKNCCGSLCHADCVVASISVMYHCNCCLFTLLQRWNLQPCQERRNLLYRLVYVAVCVALCSA